MIQPINNPTFQAPSQAMENSPPARKPFHQVLKEKADARKDSEKDSDQATQAAPQALLDFWVNFFGQEPIPLESEVSPEVPGQAGNGALVINGVSNPALPAGGNGVDIPAQLSPQAEASLNLASLSPTPKSEDLSLPIEGPAEPLPAGSAKTESLSPFLTEEMVEQRKKMADASETLRGARAKEGSTWSPNNFLGAEENGGARPLNPMLASTRWGEEPPFFAQREFQDPYLGTDASPNSSAKESIPINIEGPRFENQALKNMDILDPSRVGDPFTTTARPDHGTMPAANATSVSHHPRPISALETFQMFQRIGERVLWSVRNNEEVIRLNLQPPELGRLVIEIQKEHDQIKATLFADNSLTKEILDTHQFRLQKSLEENGFKLAQYDVFVQKDMGSFQQFEGNSVFQDGQERRAFSTSRLESDSTHPEDTNERLTPGHPGSQVIDRWV